MWFTLSQQPLQVCMLTGAELKAMYRVFPRDSQGRFSPGLDFECQDDDAALAQARLLVPSGPAEVWQGVRLVGVLTS